MVLKSSDPYNWYFKFYGQIAEPITPKSKLEHIKRP